MTDVAEDHKHHVTRGFHCSKVKKLITLHTSAQRLRAPLLKEGQSHRTITWAEALARILERIIKCIKDSRSIVYYTDSGSTGALKNLEKRFFNQLPQVFVPRGSLCWRAGIAAQRTDFGRALSHPPQDILNAKTIVLWGRNPAWLKEARARKF